MYICIYKGRQREAASLGLHALSREQDRGGISALHWSHAATSSSLKAAKGPFFFLLPLSSHLYQQHKMHHGGGVQSVVELLSLGGFGDTNRQSVGPLRAAHMPCRPRSRQALWTGVWHRGDGGATNRTVRRRRGGSKCTAGWTTSVTPCFRFPWRQDQTLSTLPPQSLFPPARAALTHHTLTAW